MAVVKHRARWQAKVRAHDGTWWSITCELKVDAQRHEVDMRRAKDRGEPWIHPRDRARELSQAPTMRELAEVFIRAQVGRLSRRTIRRYGRELESFVAWAEDRGEGLVTHLSRGLLRAWWTAYAELTGCKPQTANKVVKTVEVWWRWLDDHDDEHSAGGRVPKPRHLEMPRIQAAPVVAPTWGEMDDALNELDRVEWARRCGWILRFTGARIGEVLLLRWSDVDLETGWIHLRAETTKGGYGGRQVPISRHLARELREWERADSLVVGPVDAAIADTSRPARVFATAWARAGVRPAAWSRQATRAYRKGVQSGLIAMHAHADAVKLLVGHTLGGARASYLDPEIAIPLRQVVDMIPAVGASEV